MAQAQSESKAQHELRVVRDTIESIWVAILLAFVLRVFVIEAFVIPTGSMAPRLLGRHCDLLCPACGYEFAYGVDESQPSAHGQLARCPTCGKEFRCDDEYVAGGDRVLVQKYFYQFRQPARWEVIVFKNPQDNHVNYIKRLIGLPGETIQIVHGDIFVCHKLADEKYTPWEIQRKPKQAQDAMWQVVYDNDYRSDPVEQPSGPAWSDPKDGHWKLDVDGQRVFDFLGSQGDSMLSFQPPRNIDRAGRPLSIFLPYYGYDSSWEFDRKVDADRDICTDLKLSAVIVPGDAPSTVGLDLSSFENQFRAEVTTDGKAQIEYQTEQGRSVQSASIKPMRSGQGYRLALTHVDLEVTLWVDDEPVIRSTTRQYNQTYRSLMVRTGYDPDTGARVALPEAIPDPQVRIRARGGPCQLRHVQLMRDVFYTNPRLDSFDPGPNGNFQRTAKAYSGLKMNDQGWATTGNPMTLQGDPNHPDDFDEFFVLGDNSPMSLDGRMWVKAAPTLRLFDSADQQRYHLGTVPRYNLIGKAMFVYWPAGYNLGPVQVPIVPNVGRMRLIR